MPDIRKEIRIFIIDEFGIRDSKLEDSTSLFDSGIVDSLGLIKLTAFIEKKFKVIINPSEVTMDNFNTIAKIVVQIDKKKRGVVKD
jgi:acyl carrier protein